MSVEMLWHVPSFAAGWKLLRKIAGSPGRRNPVGFPVGLEKVSDIDDVISRTS